MNNPKTKMSEPDLIIALKAEIEKLKTELRVSRIKEGVGFDIADGARKQMTQVYQRNEWLEKRNKVLENPEPGYTKLGWMGKIVFCIRKLGRPLRGQEIMEELRLMDKQEKLLNNSWNPDKLISSVLARGVKGKRVYLFNVAGTRGAYYAVENWVNEKGELDEDMIYEMM